MNRQERMPEEFSDPFEISAFGSIKRTVRSIEDAFSSAFESDMLDSFYFALYDRSSKTFQSFTIGSDFKELFDISNRIINAYPLNGFHKRALNDYINRIYPNALYGGVHMKVTASYERVLEEGLKRIFENEPERVTPKVWRELYFRYHLPSNSIGNTIYQRAQDEISDFESKLVLFFLRNDSKLANGSTRFKSHINIWKIEAGYDEIEFREDTDMIQPQLTNWLYAFLDEYMRSIGKQKNSLTMVFPSFFYRDFIGLVFWNVTQKNLVDEFFTDTEKRKAAAHAFSETRRKLADGIVDFLRSESVREALSTFERYGRDLQAMTIIEIINSHIRRLPLLKATPLQYHLCSDGRYRDKRIMLTKSALDMEYTDFYTKEAQLLIDGMIPRHPDQGSEPALFLVFTTAVESVEENCRGYISTVLRDIQTLMLSAVYIKSATLRAEVDPTGHGTPRGHLDWRSKLVGRAR